VAHRIYFPERKRFRVLAFWLDGQITEEFEMEIEGTPCEIVVRDLRLLHHPDRLQQLYDDPRARKIGAISYMGVPLLDAKGGMLGHLTAPEFEQMEKENYLRALELTGWRIAGRNGAAQMVQLKASTFASRMKALGIQRPRPA